MQTTQAPYWSNEQLVLNRTMAVKGTPNNEVINVPGQDTFNESDLQLPEALRSANIGDACDGTSAHKPDASSEDGPNVHIIHERVIETVFDPLPTEPKQRKQEQDHRRKLKDKVRLKYQECLIVDTVHHNIGEREEKQYTNTILLIVWTSGGNKQVN